MIVSFTSPLQETLYSRAIKGLRETGYDGGLLIEGYEFPDWFVPSNEMRRVHAAAFAQTPVSDSTACFAVLLPDGVTGPNAIHRIRALGAPAAFEIHPDRFELWTVGKNLATTTRRMQGGVEELEESFRQNRQAWSGPEVMRLKNAAIRPAARQLDFIDLGLIPALEEHVRTKLEAILKETLFIASRAYTKDTGYSPDPTELFRLTFALLSAKILRDRGIDGFSTLGPGKVVETLAAIENYYKTGRPILDHLPTQQIIADGLFQGASLSHISVETLSYIWEDAFVTDEDREKLGIHGTPYSLARHIAYRLPVENFGVDDRHFLEPCCGNGVFLVAAMQRLRDLLPPEMSEIDRHAYFKRMLRGFEIEPFSIEVASLCLSLADFPSGNGWSLQKADVIDSAEFGEAISRSKIVLCNPPFEAMDASERSKYSNNLKSHLKAAQILHRVLDDLPEDGVLGFVLPQKFIDGASYRELRSKIARRFGEIEIASLPDGVFRKAQHKSCLLICKFPSQLGETTTVSYASINNREWKDLRENSLRSASRVGEMSQQEAEQGLRVAALSRLWSYLRGGRTIGNFADVNRGLRWNPIPEIDRRDPRYRDAYRSKYTRSSPEQGFFRGYADTVGLQAFALPAPEFLSCRPEDQYNQIFELDWKRPKVVINATRFDRYDWRVAAAPDMTGMVFSQRFIIAWPRHPWTPNCLAGVLNGPLASAFLAEFDPTQDIRTNTVKRIPTPDLTESEFEEIERLIEAYRDMVTIGLDSTHKKSAERLLLRIDAAILRGYDLPPRVERELLEGFRTLKRRVPHPFGPYFPESLRAFIPLSTYISDEYQRSTASDFLATIPLIDSADSLRSLTELE